MLYGNGKWSREEGSQNVCINKPAPAVGDHSLIPWGNSGECCEIHASDLSSHPQQSNWGIFTENPYSSLVEGCSQGCCFPAHAVWPPISQESPRTSAADTFTRLSSMRQTPVAMLGPKFQSACRHFLNSSSSPELPWKNHVRKENYDLFWGFGSGWKNLSRKSQFHLTKYSINCDKVARPTNFLKVI